MAAAAAAANFLPAMAQSAPGPDDLETTAVERNDVAVVTATKRETDLQDTAISIAVLDSQAMDRQPCRGAARHRQQHAKPASTTFEARQSALTVGMRGIVPNDANQPAREQGVGVYLDGVYLVASRASTPDVLGS